MNTIARLLRALPVNNFHRRKLYLAVMKCAVWLRELGKRFGL